MLGIQWFLRSFGWTNVSYDWSIVFLGPVQTPNFSWAEPNSNWGRPKFFRPAELIQTPILMSSRIKSKRRKMLISVKLLTKYLIVIYALGSIHDKFGVWAVPKSLQRRNSRPGQAWRTAEPLQIETRVPNWFRRRTFHVLNSMYILGSTHEKFSVWTGP